MKRKICFIFILIFCSSNVHVFAQKLPILSKTLKDGNISSLNEYIIHNEEIFANEFRENSIYWRLYREILPGYYEGTLQLIFTEAYSDWRHKQFRQQVNIIAKDSTIIFFQIKGLDSFNHYKTIIDSNVNFSFFTQFQNDFYKTYKSKLNRKYLFIDSINYEEKCSEQEDNSLEYDKMIKLVKNKNIIELNEWLRCGNSELQLFAVKGLFILKSQKQNIDEETSNLIHIILQKKGNINFFVNCRERRIQMDKLTRDYLHFE